MAFPNIRGFLLSEQFQEEINDYFRLRLSKVGRGSIGHSADNVLDAFLRDCHFVYIADGGSVLHTEKFCSRSYSRGPVPFDIAYEKGYRTLCPKCARNSYIERLLEERKNRND